MAVQPPLSKKISVAGVNVAVLPPSCKNIGVAGVKMAVLPHLSKNIGVAGVKMAVLPPSLQERTSLCGLSLTNKHGYGRE